MLLEHAIDFVHRNLKKFAWDDFAAARLDFPEFASIPNTLLERGSKEYSDIERYFASYFKCKVRCNHNFVVRIFNSAVITTAGGIDNLEVSDLA